jgi:hypothetical protein
VISSCMCVGSCAADCLLILMIVGWVCLLFRLLFLADFHVMFPAGIGGVGLFFRLFSLDLRTLVALPGEGSEVSVDLWGGVVVKQ